ncbi:PEGA domain-containing protein [Chitinispirillales bacterium ANBcel5]|uniref:PEGA domain-containing protein n=1 Tax=Cellulosispirillum alkaliphilum TaxID=3039283 RepID=UPI002A5607AB|nr:PEGA domain-containing protein [Chitinispirillales bacterium ANBcel5]
MTKILCLLIILLISLADSQPINPFRIASFESEPEDSARPRDMLIKNEGSAPLTELSGIPRSINPGELVVRVKEEGRYKLYKGYIDTNAFNTFPPFYSFDIPAWSNFQNIVTYKFYQNITDNHSLDIEKVYFDNQRIYVMAHSDIFFVRDQHWHNLKGSNTRPAGSLFLTSNPPGADVYLSGKKTGLKTPYTLENLIPGTYEVELFLPKHNFNRRQINVYQDSIVSASFELISDFDTLHIIGEEQHGLLVIPYPPVDTPFVIGDSTFRGHSFKLLDGEHRVRWDGGSRYRSIDTTVTIKGGKVSYFNIPYSRLYGTVKISTFPEDVLVCIEGVPCNAGKQTLELKTGLHSLTASKRGYDTKFRRILVQPDVITHLQLTLGSDFDRDKDGFPDSVDRCPDVYGLYFGCPTLRFRDAFALKMAEVEEYVRSDSLTFGISLVSTINRNPTRRQFGDFISTFTGGRAAMVNNYRGIAAGNIFHVSWRGLIAQLELGQWSSGLRYSRSDTLRLQTPSDNYLVYQDSLAGIQPTIYLPSTAVSLGVRYQLNRFTLIYALGYQWEDIIIEQLQSENDGEFHNVTFDNDFFFHEIQVKRDLFTDLPVMPALYAKVKFPFGQTLRTRWHILQLGLQLNFSPPRRRRDEL